LELLATDAGAAQPIDRPAPRRGGNPRSRVGRQAIARPVLERGDEGVLDRFLGQVEVADSPDQAGDDPP